jgi:hypothetical protein
MNLISELDYPYAFLVGIALQIFIGLIFRKAIVGAFDLFLINLLYVSFGAASLVIIYTSTQQPKIMEDLILLALWVVGMVFGSRAFEFFGALKHRRSKANTQGGQISFRGANDISAFCLICVIYLLYALQIFTSGILSLDGSLIDSRFVVQQDNKFQAYLFTAANLLPAVLLFRLRADHSIGRIFLLLFPFWIVQALTLSKTGMLFPVISLSLYYSLAIAAGIKPRLTIKGQILFGGILLLIVGLVFAVISRFLSDTGVSALGLLLNRLFSSFDGLVYLAQMNYGMGDNLSLFQWYASPFLKVLGLFDQAYNAFNYIIAVQYFGLATDYSGNLPNNNHIGELLVTIAPGWRQVAALISGSVYGLVYFGAAAYVRTGGAFIIPAAFVVATPFGFLVDGQGWCIALSCAGLLVIPACLIAKIIGLWQRRRRLFRTLKSHRGFIGRNHSIGFVRNRANS